MIDSCLYNIEKSRKVDQFFRHKSLDAELTPQNENSPVLPKQQHVSSGLGTPYPEGNVHQGRRPEGLCSNNKRRKVSQHSAQDAQSTDSSTKDDAHNSIFHLCDYVE